MANKKIRHRKVMIVSGAKKMGKSSFVAERIKKAKGNCIITKHPINIHDPAFDFLSARDYKDWRKGVSGNNFTKCKASISPSMYKDFLKWVMLGNFKNGLLIIDDCSAYEKNKTSKELDELLIYCRHNGVDVILVFHGLRRIPNDMFDLVELFVFYSDNSNFELRRGKIENFEEMSIKIMQARENQRIAKAKGARWKPTYFSQDL